MKKNILCFVVAIVTTSVAYSHSDLASKKYVRDDFLKLPATTFIEKFPHYLLENNVSIFDVCNEDGNFKVIPPDLTTESPYYVRSTYKFCVESELVKFGNSYKLSCKNDLYEDRDIPTSHKIYLIQFLGTTRELTKYLNNFSLSTKAPSIKDKIIDFPLSDLFISNYRTVTYQVPNCN